MDDGEQPVKVIRKGSEFMRFVATRKGAKLPGYGGELSRHKVGDSINMSLTGMPVDVRGIGYCAYQWLTTGTVDGVVRGLEKGELVSASLDKDSGIAVVDFRMFEHPQLHTVTWIDTRNDYVPVRDEVQVVLPGRPPRVDQRVETSWDRINKTVVPVKSTSKIFGRGGDADNVREVRLTWKTVNEPVPEKLFSQEDLKLPNGTYIVDALGETHSGTGEGAEAAVSTAAFPRAKGSLHTEIKRIQGATSSLWGVLVCSGRNAVNDSFR